jgi:hypothetical protein
MLTSAMGLPQTQPTSLLTDNNAALILSKAPQFHACAKHINTKWHFIRELTDNRSIQVGYVPSKDNIADILTKLLPTPACRHLHKLLGLCNKPQTLPFEEEFSWTVVSILISFISLNFYLSIPNLFPSFDPFLVTLLHLSVYELRSFGDYTSYPDAATCT